MSIIAMAHQIHHFIIVEYCWLTNARLHLFNFFYLIIGKASSRTQGLFCTATVTCVLLIVCASACPSYLYMCLSLLVHVLVHVLVLPLNASHYCLSYSHFLVRGWFSRPFHVYTILIKLDFSYSYRPLIY